VRKRILGAASGVAFTAGLAATLLTTGMTSASPTAQPIGTSGSAVHKVVAAAVKLAPKPKPKPAPKLPPIPLPVPAPPSTTLSPDPSSTACRSNPSTAFCSPDSVRYLVTGTTLAAHNKWLPVLKKWGATSVLDTCVSAPKTAGQQCLTQVSHAGKRVTVFFKVAYDTKYAPDTIKTQADTIHSKAIADVQKAKTVAQQGQILAAANARIAGLERAAAVYNAGHPKATVNVVVD
jgi:hypothetical protein